MYWILRTLILKPILKKIVSIERPEVIPKAGGVILAPNHVDWLDGFYLSAAVEEVAHRRVTYLTASNNYALTGVALQVAKHPDSTLEKAVDLLRAGGIICNFPEGQRNFSHQLQPGKSGTVRMAVYADVPVVPVGIVVRPGRTMWESIRNLIFTQNPIAITFGAPIKFTPPAGPIDKAWLREQTAMLMNAISKVSKMQPPVATTSQISE